MDRQLIFDLLKLIHPKCYKCNEVATKVIRFVLALDGEIYKCDACSNPELAASYKLGIDIQDIGLISGESSSNFSNLIRNINKLLDDHQPIETALIKQLYFYVYPKCDKCNRPATMEIKYPPIKHSKIFRCDYCKFAFVKNNGIQLSSGVVEDLNYSPLLRKIKLIMDNEQSKNT